MREIYTPTGSTYTAKEVDDAFTAACKQEKLDRKYKLPSFDCPNPKCSAKHILFAGDKIAKNETVLEMLKENGVADYVIVCPKCKQYIAVRRHIGKQVAPVSFRTVGGFATVCFYNVYNHRIRGIYDTKPDELVFEGIIDENIGNEQEKDLCVNKTYSFKRKSLNKPQYK